MKRQVEKSSSRNKRKMNLEWKLKPKKQFVEEILREKKDIQCRRIVFIFKIWLRWNGNIKDRQKPWKQQSGKDRGNHKK